MATLRADSTRSAAAGTALARRCGDVFPSSILPQRNNVVVKQFGLAAAREW